MRLEEREPVLCRCACHGNPWYEFIGKAEVKHVAACCCQHGYAYHCPEGCDR